MDKGQRRRHSSAFVVSFLSNHVPWLEVKTGGLSGTGRFIFRLRWPGSPATPRDGTRSAASPKKSKIRRKITIRKRIKSTIKIKSRTSCTRPTNAGRPALPRAPDPTPAPPLALSPLPDLTLHLSLSTTKNAAKTPRINKRNRLPLSALRCHRDRLSITILAPFLAVVLFLLCASRLPTRQSQIARPLGRKETALDSCSRAVSFRLSFVLPASLSFFRKAAGRCSRRWISISSRDWLCFRPAGPVDPDSTF